MAAAQKQISIIQTKSLCLREDSLWRRGIKLLDLVLVIMLGEAGNTAFAECCRFALVRYNANGSVDTNFGKNGKVLTNFISSQHVAAHAMRIDSRYRIVVAGETYSDDGYQFVVARYNSNGTLDTTFDGGKVVTNFRTKEDALMGTAEAAAAVAIDASAQQYRIVAAGWAYVTD